MELHDHDQPGFSRSRSLGYQTNLLARQMGVALGERIRRHGVEPGQFAQLLALYEEDGQSVTGLAAAVSIEHPTMSRTLARMERDGLVRIEPDAEDGRSRRVFLTDHARTLESVLKAEATAVNDQYIAVLDPAERNQLIELLGRVVDASRHELR